MENNINNCYAEWRDAACEAQQKKTAIEAVLCQMYGNNTAKALQFLIDRVDEATLSEFITTFVNPEQLALQASARIIVRRAEKGTRITGNNGHIQICVDMGDGQPQLLHFTNQASTVYYLMFLIDRHQKQGQLQPVSLRSNRAMFADLYHAVYSNISTEGIDRRYERLLFRHEGNTLRAGRQNEIILDIRKHLNRLFDAYGQNFTPYAMTAHSHLAVPGDRISFEGGAEQLLALKCA